MTTKLLFIGFVGLVIGMITGWIAFDSIGLGLGVGIAMSIGIGGVLFALDTEKNR